MEFDLFTLALSLIAFILPQPLKAILRGIKGEVLGQVVVASFKALMPFIRRVTLRDGRKLKDLLGRRAGDYAATTRRHGKMAKRATLKIIYTTATFQCVILISICIESTNVP